MAVERLVGMLVSDDMMYQQYRENMMPILHRYGGAFKYDFKIDEVLKSAVKEPMNRVFIIRFDSQENMSAFFNDKNYLQVRQEFFEPSVSSFEEIATYSC